MEVPRGVGSGKARVGPPYDRMVAGEDAVFAMEVKRLRAAWRRGTRRAPRDPCTHPSGRLASHENPAVIGTLGVLWIGDRECARQATTPRRIANRALAGRARRDPRALAWYRRTAVRVH